MSMEITCQCWLGTLLGISFPTFCHTQCQRGSRCGKVQLDTWVELVYDGVEGSMYVVGAQTAMVSRMLAQT